MRTKIVAAILLAGLQGLALAGAAGADDTALLNRATPPPNVLVILDTSQSTTWFDKDGNTVGDEFCYPAAKCPPPDLQPQNLPTMTSRAWMAKFVLSNVVGTYGDKINFGLASYNQGNAATNVKVATTGSGSPRSWYYAEGSYKVPFGGWQAYIIGNRYYLYPYWFDLRVPQAGLGGPANAADPAGYNPATLRPNSPSFTLTWNLRDPATLTGGKNPVKEFWAGQASVPPTTHTEPRCRYTLQRSPDVTPQTWANYGSTWDTLVGGGCLASGTVTVPAAYYGAVTVTDTCTYVQRLTVDTPRPYEYSCQRYTNGTATGGPWNEYYQDSQGSSFPRNVSFAPAYWQRTIALGQVTITVTDTAGQAFRPDRYRWTYYYDAACKANCKNPGKFWQWTWSTPWYVGDPQGPTYGYTDCRANQVTDPYVDPPVMGLPACGAPWRNASNQPVWSPSPTGTWVVPLDAEYKWQGNNYALTTDNSCSGGQVLVDVGTGTKDAIQNYLGTGIDPTKELHGANRSTPLAGTLDTAYTYFTDPAGVVQTDPQKACRKHFVLLLTDGGESCLVDLTVPGQKAAALAGLPNPPGGVKTYVVGIDQGGLSNDERTVLDGIAAKGGTGNFYSASTPQTLLDALLAIIGSILGQQQYTFVPPVVPSLRAQDNLMLVQGSFKTPSATQNPNTPLWQGVLEAFDLSSQGTVPTTGLQISAPPVWEAGARLANTSGGSRNITTVVGGSQMGFTKNATVRAALNVTLDVNGDSLVDQADQDRVIDTVRGPSSGGKGFLGDIFHSVPAIVGAPNAAYVDRTFDPANPTQLLSLAAAPDTFAAFRSSQSTRQRLAIVGTNAGVLHAFNAGTYDSMLQKYNLGDGAEVWAFIPPQMLPRLQYLAVNQGHQYLLDAAVRVADVWLDANNDGVKTAGEWRTVLISGFRQGGPGLFALDITNTTSPAFLWTYPTTGQSWSEPAFGKVKVQVAGRLVDRWVAVVGDGYDATGSNGRMLHVIDIQTGRALWRYATNSPVAASPLALDVDNDGYLDRLYVGTLGGDVLRVDVAAVGRNNGGNVDPANGVMVNNWTVGVLFAAGPAQPFYTKGAATLDPAGNLWVFIGSGDRSDPMLVPGTPNRIYGVKDPYPGSTTTLTEADLSDMTGTNTLTVSAVAGQGWFIILRPGEKEWAETALVFNSQVFFTTFMPGSAGCGDLGSGTIYMVFYLTGGGVTDTALFQGTPPTASSRVYQVNAGATSRPVVTTGNLGANAVVYLSNTNMLMLTPSFSAPGSIRATRYWRRIR